MPADAGGHDRSFTQPRILSDRDRLIPTDLVANGHVQENRSVLMATVHNRYVGRNQHVLFDRHFTDGAIVSDVDSLTNRDIRIRKDRAESDMAIA